MQDALTVIVYFVGIMFAILGIPTILCLIAESIEHKHKMEVKLINKGIPPQKVNCDKIDFKTIFITKLFETLSTIVIVFFTYLFFDIFNISDTIRDFFINLFK